MAEVSTCRETIAIVGGVIVEISREHIFIGGYTRNNQAVNRDPLIQVIDNSAEGSG